jgi:thiol-disulfide isomerase/thioredoxin
MKRLTCSALLLAIVMAAVPLLAETPEPEPKYPKLPNLTLFPLDNKGAVTLDSFEGRPVLVTFWASWCGPCRWELPEFKELYDELGGRGFVLITINVDTDKRAANRFLKMTELAIPVYRLSQSELFKLGVRSLPTSILLKPDGYPVEIYNGYSPTVVNHVRVLVEEMLEEIEQDEAEKQPDKPSAGD